MPGRPPPHRAVPMSTAQVPSILQSHRERVRRLSDAMVRLHELHEQAYDVWNRIVHVREGNAQDRNAQLDAMHDEAFALADRIARERETAFGSISRDSLLRLSASVESMHHTLLAGEPAAAPGE